MDEPKLTAQVKDGYLTGAAITVTTGDNSLEQIGPRMTWPNSSAIDEAEARGYAQAEADIVAYARRYLESLRDQDAGFGDHFVSDLADYIEAGHHRIIMVPNNIDGMERAS